MAAAALSQRADRAAVSRWLFLPAPQHRRGKPVLLQMSYLAGTTVPASMGCTPGSLGNSCRQLL